MMPIINPKVRVLLIAIADQFKNGLIENKIRKRKMARLVISSRASLTTYLINKLTEDVEWITRIQWKTNLLELRLRLLVSVVVADVVPLLPARTVVTERRNRTTTTATRLTDTRNMPVKLGTQNRRPDPRRQ